MDNLFLTLYSLMWLITFVVEVIRKRRLDAGNLIVGSYLVYAILAFVLYHTPQPYYDFLPMKCFPFVYLFAMLLLATLPVMRFDTRQTTEIVPPNMTLLHLTAWIFIGCSALSIPYLYHLFSSGDVMQLFSDPEAGRSLYSESLAEADSDGSGISNLPFIIVGAFSDIAILILFYLLTLPKKNKTLIAGLVFAIPLYMLSPIMKGQRGLVINALFTILVAYFMLRHYMSSRLRKWIDRLGIAVLCLIAIPIMAITISRFGTRDGGAGGSIVYYTGQAPLNFNNYGLDAGGIRHGDRTFNLAKRLIDPSTPKNYEERRDKYNYLKMDDNVFYTFVGDFTLDFGPYIAPLIFLLFTGVILLLTKQKENKIAFHQLLLLYLIACICMQGGMYLFAYSDTSGLKMVALIVLYVILKWNSKVEAKGINTLCQD